MSSWPTPAYIAQRMTPSPPPSWYDRGGWLPRPIHMHNTSGASVQAHFLVNEQGVWYSEAEVQRLRDRIAELEGELVHQTERYRHRREC